MDEFWVDDLDLSTLTPEQFSTFFFDRPLAEGLDAKYKLVLGEFECFTISPSNPAAFVANVQAMCLNFGDLAKIYSPDQLDQGLWMIFGGVLHCEEYLFDPTIESSLRVHCVESMYLPFMDVVANLTIDVKESFYWMWDIVLHGLYPVPKEYKYGYLTLTNDQSQMIETIFKTLSKILALDHKGCQICALHGLGHLYHPSSEQLVQRYLDEHRSEFGAEDVQWIEDFRDSSVL